MATSMLSGRDCKHNSPMAGPRTRPISALSLAGMAILISLVGLARTESLGAQEAREDTNRPAAGARAEEPEAPTGGAAAAQSAQAVVPQLIKFTGTLQNLSGKPISGAVDVTFSLYAQESGGAPLWSETQTVQADALGRYTALLGAMTPTGVPLDVFTGGEARWLGVQVTNLPEQARVLLVSVPYAMKAGDAQTLGGRPASAYQLVSGSTGGEDTAAAGTTAGREATQQGTTAGRAASTPTKRLTPLAVSAGPTNFSGSTTNQIVGATQAGTGVAISAAAPNNNAIVGTASNTTGAYSGVKGITNSAAGAGLYGLDTAAGGWAVDGYASSATGATVGVQGVADSTSGTAMSGWERATTGATIGLVGSVASSSGIGLKGKAYAAAGNTTGILASVSSPTGTGLVINNLAGGKLFSGQNNGAESIGFNANGSGYFTGSMGVGTSTPISPLQVATGDIVVGPVVALPYSNTNGVYVNNDLGDSKNTFRFDAYKDDLAIAGLSSSGAATGTTISFRTATAGGYESNRMRIDSSGNVGIGTTTPAASLHVVGSTVPSGRFQNNGGGSDHTSVVDLENGDGSLWRMSVGGSGNGLGFTGGDFYIEENGSGAVFRMDTSHDIWLDEGHIMAANFSGEVLLGPCAGITPSGPYTLTLCQNNGNPNGKGLAFGWDTSSSRRFKTNIKTLRGGLSKVERLRGVTYNDKSDGTPEVGVIAEEVEKVVPEVVAYDKDGQVEGLDYSRLTAVLIEAVKAQQRQIRTQRSEIGQLKKASAAHRAQMNATAAQLKALAAQNFSLAKEVEQLRKSQDEIAALAAPLNRSGAQPKATRALLAGSVRGRSKQNELARVRF